MCYHSKEYDKIPIRGLTADGGHADPWRNGGWSALHSDREKEREMDQEKRLNTRTVIRSLKQSKARVLLSKDLSSINYWQGKKSSWI